MKTIVLARYSPRPLPPKPTEDDLKRGEEDRKKNSCDVQLEDARRWCAANGHEIVQEFREDNLSGDEDRPILTEAIEACKRGYMLLVRDFQRVSRNGRFLMYVAGDLAARRVTLQSMTEGKYEHEDDEAWLSFGVRALFGEYYRRKVKKSTKAKMLLHQKNGRRMSKILPFGRMLDPADPKRHIPCPEEVAVIDRMAALYRDGLGVRAIARQLEAEGILCRGNARWHHRLVADTLRTAGVRLNGAAVS